MSNFQGYVNQVDSASKGLLVALLLDYGACPNAKAGLLGSELEGLTPLHILSCWQGGEVQAGSMRPVLRGVRCKPLRSGAACIVFARGPNRSRPHIIIRPNVTCPVAARSVRPAGSRDGIRRAGRMVFQNLFLGKG